MAIQVREYACLTTDKSAQASLDMGIVSKSTFDWLFTLNSDFEKGKRPLRLIAPDTLKLKSFVGYLQSPTGEAIEVLPKTRLGEGESHNARQILQNMLQSSLRTPAVEVGAANLLRMNVPLHEWVLGQFLVELKLLVQRGLRFDYRCFEEESRYIRGQLNITKQLRQPPGKEAHFHIRHDEFSPQRIENRLLRSALIIAQYLTQEPDNWRLANTLSHQLEVIEPSNNPLLDMQRWTSGKLMQSYDAIRPWCQLVIEKLNPNFQQGRHRGIALLFPMEQLFENHVAACLQKQLGPGWRLQTQVKTQYLLTQPSETSRQLFQLRPDLVLSNQSTRVVMDTKWKLIDGQSLESDKYGIKQSDLYQMFAYGHKYLNGCGELVLIYPAHDRLRDALAPFYYDKGLRLWAVPFCLEAGILLGNGWPQALEGIESKVLGE